MFILSNSKILFVFITYISVLLGATDNHTTPLLVIPLIHHGSHHYQSYLLNFSKSLTNNLKSPINQNRYGFSARLEIGTRHVEQFLYVDSGSNLLWVNCLPCDLNIPAPIYEPRMSLNYKREPCYSKWCASSGAMSISCGKKRECTYVQRYADDNTNNGHIAAESLYFGQPTVGMFYRFDDPDFQREMKMFPYKVIDKDGKPHVEVKTRVGETAVYSPEEITAMILRKMKETAEAYLGKEVKDAVITFPGCFSHEQIEATRRAGTVAGLRVARILNEAIAAAYVYGLEKEDDKNILVLDFGGGSFDVSVLYVEREVFEVLATSCNRRLGGENFDRRVVDYFVQLIKTKYNKDISQEQKDLQELLKECERAKIALSNHKQVFVESYSLLDGIKLSEQLTRAKFEELNIDYFQEMIMMVKRALLDANLTMSDIHEIVFVGGSSHIPMVRQLFKDFFAGKEVAKSIDPAEVVVHGAAILGEVLNRAMCQAGSRLWSASGIPWPFCFQKYYSISRPGNQNHGHVTAGDKTVKRVGKKLKGARGKPRTLKRNIGRSSLMLSNLNTCVNDSNNSTGLIVTG